MPDREPSTGCRFDQIWAMVSDDGAESIQAPVEAGTASVVMSAKEEPYIVGSLRPRVRVLEIMTKDGGTVSLADGLAVLSPDSEYVRGVLSAMERILPTRK